MYDSYLQGIFLIIFFRATIEGLVFHLKFIVTEYYQTSDGPCPWPLIGLGNQSEKRKRLILTARMAYWFQQVPRRSLFHQALWVQILLETKLCDKNKSTNCCSSSVPCVFVKSPMIFDVDLLKVIQKTTAVYTTFITALLLHSICILFLDCDLSK